MTTGEIQKYRRPTRAERMNLIIQSIPEALKAWGFQIGEGYDWNEVVFNLARVIVFEEFDGRPRDKLTQKQIDIAISFWMRAFEVEDPEKRKAFEVELRERLTPDYGELSLYVDYDPIGLLLDCVRAIGIECSGCLGSAEGLFPGKTGTNFDQYRGGVRIRLGRGNDIGIALEVADLDRMLEGYRIGLDRKGY